MNRDEILTKQDVHETLTRLTSRLENTMTLINALDEKSTISSYTTLLTIARDDAISIRQNLGLLENHEALKKTGGAQ